MLYRIRKGYDVKISGKPDNDIDNLKVDRVGYTLSDFKYLKPKVLVNEGDRVKKGQALFVAKKDEALKFVSPVSGVVEGVVRGDRRVLLNVTVRPEGEDKESFDALDASAISGLDFQSAVAALKSRGLFPMLRQRPYNMIADESAQPNSIFIKAIESEPIAADPNFIIKNRGADFNLGLEILKKLCGRIFLCTEGNSTPDPIFSSAQGVEVHSFAGPHPRGNLSVHIENLDPMMTSDKHIWYINALDVAAIGKTLSTGEYDAERLIAYTGPGVEKPKYLKTTALAQLNHLPQIDGENRIVSGGVLTGRNAGVEGFLGFYDYTVVCLAEGRKRELLGWLKPGFGMPSFTRTFLSSLTMKQEFPLTTNLNGEHRAIVDSELFDHVQPLDVPTIFLFKSLLAGDIEEAEKMGLWGVAGEDFALATYIDPCKNDFVGVVEDTFDRLYKEQ